MSLENNNLDIVAALRTPIASSFRSLKDYDAVHLSEMVIRELIKRKSFSLDTLSEVIIGNAVGAGIGQNLARQAALNAGIPETIPAYTVNSVCGSGVQALIQGAQAIMSGTAKSVLVGASESSTYCPVMNWEDGLEESVDSLIHDGLWCPMSGKHMGDLAEATAQKFGITREEQDLYALESHQKAVAAQSEGVLEDEIVAVPLMTGGDAKLDDRPRKNLKMESLQDLKPAFQKEGVVTAGNASIPCDAACAVVLRDSSLQTDLEDRPLGRLKHWSFFGVPPAETFSATAPAVLKCLEEAGLSIDDVDLFEIGESFAAQMVLAIRELKVDTKKVNIYGGDIAYGHALGVAGLRIIVTLLYALRRKSLRRGLACISFGGGGSLSVIVENFEY